jgi:hypothetical protein
VAKRRKPRIIFDLKNMDKEKWSKYAQEIESEFKKIKIEEKIQRARGKENSNDNEVDITLQEIWSSIERTLQTTGKRTISTKNIKCTSKSILKDRGHTPSFKDLREITGIYAAIKKLQKNKDPNLFNEIDGRINIMAGKYPLLTLKDFSNTTNIVEIP